VEYKNLLREITKEFGEIIKILPNCNWTAPIEYVNEMGENLESEIWFIDKHELSQIISIKHWMMFFEYQYSKNSNRQFNLNPGYVSEQGMFLLTHKDNRERGRENIDSGIWQEKQYQFSEQTFKPIINTFSEYLSPVRLSLFNDLLLSEKPILSNRKIWYLSDSSI